MPYTAKGSYFDAGAGREDKALIRKYQEQWAAADAAVKAAEAAGDEAARRTAEAARAQAHASAEAVRGGYGYSGGADGSEYLPLRSQTDALVDEYRSLFGADGALYRQRLDAQRGARDAAVQRAVERLNAGRADTEAQYADLFRQLYIDRMNNEKNLDQKLAAGGVTGGAAETTRLGYDTAYEDALRQGEQSRIAALGEIDRAVADARLTGELEQANAAEKAAREQANAYAEALRYLISRRDAIDARQEGYARADAQRLAEERRNAEKPALTPAQVNAAIKRGIITDAVRAAYAYYYGAPYRG